MSTYKFRYPSKETVLLTFAALDASTPEGTQATGLHLHVASIDDPDTDIQESGEFLASMGGRPPWLLMVRCIRMTLEHCPELDHAALMEYLTTPVQTRVTAAESAKPTSLPLWLAWAMTFDPSERVAKAWMARFPVGPDGETAPQWAPLFAAALADERLTTFARARVPLSVKVARETLASDNWAAIIDLVERGHLSEDQQLDVARRTLDRVGTSSMFVKAVTLTPAIAHLLADSPHPTVLKQLARRPEVPPEVLIRLEDHPDFRVAQVAWGRDWIRLGRKPTAHPDWVAFRARWLRWCALEGIEGAEDDACRPTWLPR